MLQHIGMLGERFDVRPLRRQLREHPYVWNWITIRTSFEGSAHREVDDIWIRYNAFTNWYGDGDAFNSEHTSVWYPIVEELPDARLLAIELKERLGAWKLGGVLITRIPARKQVYAHVDRGWHAGFYEKFVIQIASAPGQRFCFEDGGLEAEPGECYWFDNSYSHWVENPTEHERISLIVCLRRNLCH